MIIASGLNTVSLPPDLTRSGILECQFDVVRLSISCDPAMLVDERIRGVSSVESTYAAESNSDSRQT